jgi:hypothetical protein
MGVQLVITCRRKYFLLSEYVKNGASSSKSFVTAELKTNQLILLISNFMQARRFMAHFAHCVSNHFCYRNNINGGSFGAR